MLTLMLTTPFFISLTIVNYSVDGLSLCPKNEKPPPTVLELAYVYEKKTPDLTLGRISIDSIPGYKIRNNNSVYLATSRDHACGGQLCTFELATNENHARDGWIFHQNNLIPRVPPITHRYIPTAKEMYCVYRKNDCSADVPIYRHIRVTKDGFHHLYTIGDTDLIDGYLQERTPLCYGWNVTTRLDHKFVPEGREMFRIFEQYRPTGEVFYCAKKFNDCGATITLRKYFNYFNIDTIYTANSETAPEDSVSYPEGVLCYIWDSAFNSQSQKV
uniref:ZP domain-containing protein n=1 Tax=Syphacia muris TaxID=451379 RepID=A0A0N5AS16_9BILA